MTLDATLKKLKLMSMLRKEESIHARGNGSSTCVKGKIFCLSWHSDNLRLFSHHRLPVESTPEHKNGAMKKMPSGPQNMPTVGWVA